MGDPLGTPGKGPDDPAISMCEYFKGWLEFISCLSSPDALIKKAAGNW